ncbi:energy-coupling factor ABC transporter ATP-binding protein [Bacillus taeanensis]|uniref:Energy-coupling factor ABC transporter ATP-binding protein n=1 Tax=Bacillus taeanensis TaxID=273032 RepID=A0A366XRN1_9BACI|nr:energy-coupling factor ABC transporter ATP-binding protein [Bacillus taeanensis]RBW67785.1 energy-coupling factor ABC transporter ATP-binding protein [Bacillus taeanensis]
MKKLVTIEDLHFRYQEDADWSLKGVNLSIYKGEWLAIVGHNGSGKSTLAKHLNGLLIPQKGTVAVEGFYTNNSDDIWEIRRRIGMVFQNPDNQFVGTSVRDDVAFGLENIGVPREEMIERITASIEKVKMTAFLDQEPHHLSGGQKQRVAIAGIIALKPSLIVLDEAASMLDPMGRQEVIEVVRQLNRTENITVISITHDLEEAAEADRMIVMNKGKLLMEGTPREVFRQGEKLQEIGLDLPFSIKLKNSLKKRGIQLEEEHLTQEELVEALWTLKSQT